jgi:hypothetical protein
MLNPNNMDMDLESYFDDDDDDGDMMVATTNNVDGSDVAMTEFTDGASDISMDTTGHSTSAENEKDLLENCTLEKQLEKMKFTNMDLSSFVSFIQKDEFMKNCIYNVEMKPILDNLENSNHEIQDSNISDKYTPLLIRKSIHCDPEYILANVFSKNLFPIIENYYTGLYSFKILSGLGIAYNQFYGKNFGMCVYVPFNRSRKIVGFYKQIDGVYDYTNCFLKHIVTRSDLPVNKDDVFVLREHRGMDEELTGSDLVSSTKYKKFEKTVKNMKTIGDYVQGLTKAYNEAKNPNQIRAILDIYEEVLYL